MAGEEAIAVAVAVAVATGGYDPGIKTRDSCASLCRPDHVNRLEITPDRRLLAAAGNPSIQFYEINPEVNCPMVQVLSYDSHIRNVTAIGFERDGNWMYSGSEDGMASNLKAMVVALNIACMHKIAKSWLQMELISDDQNGNMCVWDLGANACSIELVPEADTAMRYLEISFRVTSSKVRFFLFCSPRIACGLAPYMHQMIAHLEPLHRMQAHSGYILRCLLSPELCSPVSSEASWLCLFLRTSISRILLILPRIYPRYLASASSDHNVKIWSADTFALLQTLAASSDTTARVWNVDTGNSVGV
ncbi:protein LST8 homolog [Ananas comosus]|uniref:Target of rapamycin complex subunit LST8 n=1 Tax=Ananas comosus TaxID=4615 RepID=A0A6P5FR82_ANACO|nr:protein LST8 homolog [Ananas comosus]